MDLNQLRAFVEVGRRGSFSLAADSLELTQSGVSRQVRQIEKELGLRLIGREQRPVTLTKAGRDFLSCAVRVLDDFDATVEAIRTGSRQLAGPLKIAASTIPGEFIVPGLLARFANRHPGVRPNLLVTDSAGVVAELLAGRADVGFLGAAVEHSRLRLSPVGEDEIILAAPAGHPLAGRGAVSLDDLAGESFVEREGGSGTLESLKRLLSERGLTMPDHQVVITAGTSQTQLAAIEAGAGLGFVSSMALDSREHPRVVRVALRGLSFRRTLYLACDPSSVTAVGSEFVRFVTEPNGG